MDFKDKSVLITGASRGIGRATAIAFAKQGAKVGINFRSNQKEAELTLSSLEGEGHQLFQADISVEVEAKALIEKFIGTYGHIDILVNNAGIAISHPIEDVGFEDWTTAWTRTLQTNLIAAANLCFLSAKHMMKVKRGSIVNVSSRGAFRGEPDQPAYGASKAGLNALSQSLAKKLAPYNIQVGVVAPGFTETDMANEALSNDEKQSMMNEIPFKRMASPEEVAHAILFLASENAAYASGSIIDVNGASYLRS
ncbi:SDR family NAD(P)-dependent oxidoreductase [Psychroflexus tropicus]|uniref:SDR family NAD(P)-dependent oxidoreductase n=1 Tax=Psychroflexus tropicus TaxID=197345 RepID=UPI0003824046|nr:SDR family NAD(P)-dependent oxidoreductase [Psychroflexus tropicus]